MRALKLFILLSILTGFLYPLVITIISNLTMSEKAQGSFIINESGQIIGSSLIGQKFESDSYFWSRPSTNDYIPLLSSGTNLGPTSRELKDIIQKRKEALKDNVPSDLLFASASGLDPHITLEAAFFQIDRIAKARKIDPDILENLIISQMEPRIFGFLGEPCVNVLLLNLQLNTYE